MGIALGRGALVAVADPQESGRRATPALTSWRHHHLMESHMSYIVSGLQSAPFAPLFGLDDEALIAQGIHRMNAPQDGLYPCRVTLADVPAGTPVLLLSYQHQPAAGPYRADGPIFVTEGYRETAMVTGELPLMMTRRILSVRAYDGDDMMVDAEVVDGQQADTLIRRYLSQPDIAYLHVHLARRGCFAARVDRAA